MEREGLGPFSVPIIKYQRLTDGKKIIFYVLVAGKSKRGQHPARAFLLCQNMV